MPMPSCWSGPCARSWLASPVPTMSSRCGGSTATCGAISRGSRRLSRRPRRRSAPRASLRSGPRFAAGPTARFSASAASPPRTSSPAATSTTRRGNGPRCRRWPLPRQRSCIWPRSGPVRSSRRPCPIGRVGAVTCPTVAPPAPGVRLPPVHPPFSGSLASIDGAIMLASAATVPATDEGLLRGDGIFEVIRVYEGHPFAFEDHLRRLETSALNLRLPLDLEAVRADAHRLLAHAGSGPDHELLRIVLTRGGRRLLLTEPLTALPEHVRLASVTYSPTRVLDGVKSLSYGANMLARRLARERGRRRPARHAPRPGARGADQLNLLGRGRFGLHASAG